jgi:hypothetical protein
MAYLDRTYAEIAEIVASIPPATVDNTRPTANQMTHEVVVTTEGTDYQLLKGWSRAEGRNGITTYSTRAENYEAAMEKMKQACCAIPRWSKRQIKTILVEENNLCQPPSAN